MAVLKLPNARYNLSSIDILLDKQMSDFEMLLCKLIYLHSIGSIPDNFDIVEFIF